MSKINSVERTLAELGLEGISVSDELYQDMLKHQKGEISAQEFLDRAIKRAVENERSISVPGNNHSNK